MTLAPQEAELHSAVAENRAQLVSLEELLAADPDNAEVQEVYEQLQAALSYTLAALDEQQQQQEQLEEQQQQREAAAGEQQPPEPQGGDEEGGEEHEAAHEGGGAAAASATAAPAAAAAAAARPRGGAPNNARMHPANLYYRQEPDFEALAREYEELRPYVRTDSAGRAHLDTTSWEATRALTCCLLRHDFGLRWWLPEGQLVPPVPNRANYIHWIHDLLHLSAPQQQPQLQQQQEGVTSVVRGLDIGCGANFIYCLLGAVLYGWNMVGVDVTQVAVRCCQKLIEDNPQVAPLLEVRDLSYLHPELQGPDAAAPAGSVAGPGGGRRGRKRPAEGRGSEPRGTQRSSSAAAATAEHECGVEEGSGLAEGGDGGGAAEEGTDAAAAVDAQGADSAGLFGEDQEAAQNPNTAFGGTAAEMVCPGGELAFVLRMLVESEELRDRVHWFSTMVGKKNTLKALRRELHSRHVTALRTTELAQGKTSRWAVAWSWQVDPNKASQPLRRLVPKAAAATAAAGGAPAAAAPPRAAAAAAAAGPRRAQPADAAPRVAAAGVPLLARRHISFTVQQSGSLNSRAIVGEVRRLLLEAGCGPLEVDTAAWTVGWPLQVRPFSAGAAGATEPADARRPPEVSGSGSLATDIKARLRIAQQQRGRLELVATIPHTAPDAAARAFAALMVTVEQGLAAAAAAAPSAGAR
ncbi:hypothetical protein PLESTB_001554300 [Pleodorina starrii]|uniref:U6 small nuclear RNA (adenine-(43)-N(6))-methyltransferase n=1 Tax=Pleodorina starrii TaxID=330485 RepID=A0A9W6BWN7_9CHLO|nr:hypothetical protein PLESTB_001554300 [Pleodorina starrii]